MIWSDPDAPPPMHPLARKTRHEAGSFRFAGDKFSTWGSSFQLAPKYSDMLA